VHGAVEDALGAVLAIGGRLGITALHLGFGPKVTERLTSHPGQVWLVVVGVVVMVSTIRHLRNPKVRRSPHRSFRAFEPSPLRARRWTAAARPGERGATTALCEETVMSEFVLVTGATGRQAAPSCGRWSQPGHRLVPWPAI
jgi:hypothetical protein